jgi:hypothetical protein
MMGKKRAREWDSEHKYLQQAFLGSSGSFGGSGRFMW